MLEIQNSKFEDKFQTEIVVPCSRNFKLKCKLMAYNTVNLKCGVINDFWPALIKEKKASRLISVLTFSYFTAVHLNVPKGRKEDKK